MIATHPLSVGLCLGAPLVFGGAEPSNSAYGRAWVRLRCTSDTISRDSKFYYISYSQVTRIFVVIFRFVLDVLLATSPEKCALSNCSIARFGFRIGVELRSSVEA